MYLKHYFVQTAKDLLIRFPKKIGRSFSFLKEYRRFASSSTGRFDLRLKEVYPCLSDNTGFTPFDQHYIYHPAWAARILAQTRPAHHVDISSILSFSSILSAFVPTSFYDYRPAELTLDNYDSRFADLKKLPFNDNSIPSLSCMHTVEHIGLGRYGDELDYDGDLKAISELVRVLAPGGDLLFVTPVGRPRIEFNAHRVYSFEQVTEYFRPLQLVELSLVPDQGGLIRKADPALVAQQNYGCGCFWFKKNP